MRYFIDTEFIETGGYSHPTIDLISIGIVCDDGREYYAISREFQASYASQWVITNIIDPLPEMGTPLWKDRAVIRQDLLRFIHSQAFDEVEFWGYYSSYDFVAFCWLFDKMIDLPKTWPKYCRDLKQWSDNLGAPKFKGDKGDEHNALADARWNRDLFMHLKKFEAEISHGGIAVERE